MLMVQEHEEIKSIYMNSHNIQTTAYVPTWHANETTSTMYKYISTHRLQTQQVLLHPATNITK